VAETDRAGVLACAREEAARLQAEAQAAIARERTTAEALLAADAGRLAIEIARRLLLRLPAATTFELFLDGLEQAVTSLPAGTRAALDSQPVELVTAAPLDGAETKLATAMLAQALGRESVRVTFKVDPALIAGVELHAAHLVVRNSWAADLERILLELNRDDGTGRAEPLARPGDGAGGHDSARAQG
jgi:F-type H+-transporting ATPase subunit b